LSFDGGNVALLTQGREEREACYKPMKDALLEHFSDIPFRERYTGSSIHFQTPNFRSVTGAILEFWYREQG
jgi:hypothetical protein